MKKGQEKDSEKKSRVDLTLKHSPSRATAIDEEPFDELSVEVKSLRLFDEDPKHFNIRITFFDQVILTTVIHAVGAKDEFKDNMIVGTFKYNPADYEKMCTFANYPLVVAIQPFKNVIHSSNSSTIKPSKSVLSSVGSESLPIPETVSSIMAKGATNISSCNIDILPIFLSVEDDQKMCIKKRMEPTFTPTSLFFKSWDTLPLLTMQLQVNRNGDLAQHHRVLQKANWMKLTLVGMYNAILPYSTDFEYTAASKIPTSDEARTHLATFNKGSEEHRRFNTTQFYPQWESLNTEDDLFSRSDEKFVCSLENIQNDELIDLQYYIRKDFSKNTVIWGSFHRTLMLNDYEKWFYKHIRTYKWPIEVHMYGEVGGFSFMGFINLNQFLYSGVQRLRLAVPLTWIDPGSMMMACDCDPLLPPNQNFFASQTLSNPRSATDSNPCSSTDTNVQWRPTGSDDNNAFVLVEILLARPLREISIPPTISMQEINDMLRNLEKKCPVNRQCTGRGQFDSNWDETVQAAVKAIRRVPYYGSNDLCMIMRQLSEARTRVELTTSVWLNASIYTNNNFVIEPYLQSDKTFEELLMMSHASLMKRTVDTLVKPKPYDPETVTLYAARHARQMQDMVHAMDLYMELTVQSIRDANYWRELSTCLKEINRDWAAVSLNKAVVLDPRHPLTLLSKGATMFEENPEAAEPFFVALLAFHPFWTTIWVITSAYYYERGLFDMSEEILKSIHLTRAEGFASKPDFPRAWKHELGDWWDPIPLLPTTNRFLDAADLLLRLRAVSLAEVCVARALAEDGESPSYYYQVALCCRIRGEFYDALCHLGTACEKFGDVGFLRTLEGECHHAVGNTEAATEAFKKIKQITAPYCILLSLPSRETEQARTILIDLVLRHPSAYAWMALADNWMKIVDIRQRSSPSLENTDNVPAQTCAQACAVEALKWDRKAGRAWALLAKRTYVAARHAFNIRMLINSGYEPSLHTLDTKNIRKIKCNYMGTVIENCRCDLCQHVHLTVPT